MKKIKLCFLLAILLFSNTLLAQSVTQANSLKSPGQSCPDISPLMMFSGWEDELISDKVKTDSRQTQSTRVTTSAVTSFNTEERGAPTSRITEDRSSDEENEADDAFPHAAISRGGLSNNRADCFINSSLQFCKAFKDQLNLEALARMPSLTRFLNEGLSTDEECRVLRHEMATEVIKGDQDLEEAVQDGTAQTYQDAAAFLRLLLAETKASELLLEERLENSVTGETRITPAVQSYSILQLALPPDLGNSIAIQDVIQKELNSIREQHWNTADLSSRTVTVASLLQLREPIAATLVVSLGRFGFDGRGVKNKITVNGLKERIVLPVANGEQATYEPTAIICHKGDSLEVGHYVCYRKENGAWLLFNDNKDVALPIALEGNFAPKNCYVISYRRVDSINVATRSSVSSSRTNITSADSKVKCNSDQ